MKAAFLARFFILRQAFPNQTMCNHYVVSNYLIPIFFSEKQALEKILSIIFSSIETTLESISILGEKLSLSTVQTKLKLLYFNCVSDFILKGSEGGHLIPS